MSTEEKNYTELETFTEPEDVYTVPSSEPLSGTSGTITNISTGKQGCFNKLLVTATIVNFLLLIFSGATVAYFLHAQAGRQSEDSDSMLPGLTNTTAESGLSGGMQD